MSGNVVIKNVTFELREDTAANWTTKNPILRAGEPGFERDTNKLKIGDGLHSWTNLDYLTGAGSAGPAGDSAYEVAVNNGFVGTEAEWLDSLEGPPGSNGTNGVNGTNGTNGTNGVDGADGADGVDGTDGADGAPGPPGEGAYPLTGLGFVAASVHPDVAETSSTAGPWVTRIYVPAGVAFSKIGTYVVSPGVAGSVLNAYGLYDDSGTFIDQTPNDNGLWATGGWRMGSLSATIAAQSTGRFVRVAFAMNGSDPSILYRQSNDITVFNGIASGHRRSWLGPSRNAGFPSTINVATEGSTFPYIPLIVLAV